MTRVEFYSSETDNSQTPYTHLCEVIKRAYRKGQKVFVHTESRRAAENQIYNPMF